jgi:hypothetical protein
MVRWQLFGWLWSRNCRSRVSDWRLGTRKNCTLVRSFPKMSFWLCPHKLSKWGQRKKTINTFCSHSLVWCDGFCLLSTLWVFFLFASRWGFNMLKLLRRREQVPKKFVQSDSICSRLGDSSFFLFFFSFLLWMFLVNRLFSIAGDCQELESARYQIQRGDG